MALKLTSLQMVRHSTFDTIIDVRSPAEFAEDHIPGAINLPVLSNEERAEVGTIYVQDSPFKARKIGAALVARNAARHIAGPLADKEGGWSPLVYCWRGGQRSGSFTGILQQIGWRADLVEGGYQAYRRLVHRHLYDTKVTQRIILLDGNTGTAKTAILGHLSDMGAQIIDLEGLANHRGSLLGGRPGGQPSQKAFESALAEALDRLEPERPVILEAESSKIGKIIIPSQLWAAMKAAPRIEVSAPLSARAAFLTDDYKAMVRFADSDPKSLQNLLQPLRHHRGHAAVDHWESLLVNGDYEALATALMVEHYDPSYARSRGRVAPTILAKLSSDTLDAPAQQALARSIAQIVEPDRFS